MNNNNSFMNGNNSDDSFEKEILESRGVSNVEDDDVAMIKPRIKKRKNYVEKVDKIAPKNFKMRRTVIAIICMVVIAISFVISSSFARTTNVSETKNTAKLQAGTMKLEFNKGSSAIVLNNALPQLENDAIANNESYLFTITNTGDIPAGYTIFLENNCDTNKKYRINKESVTPDVCIPNKYIKVGLSVNDSDYKILSGNDNTNNIVVDSGEIDSGASNKYELKLWLALETPNDYNSKGNKNVLYSGNLNLIYNQIDRSENNSSLDN